MAIKRRTTEYVCTCPVNKTTTTAPRRRQLWSGQAKRTVVSVVVVVSW